MATTQTTVPIPVFSQPSAFAEKIGVGNINTLQDFLIYSHSKEKNISFLNTEQYRQNYYELMIDVTAGCGFWVDSIAIAPQKNRVTLIHPLQLQKIAPHAPATQPAEGFSLFFKPSFIKNSQYVQALPILNQRVAFATTLAAGVMAETGHIASKIYEEYSSGHGATEKAIMQNYLEIMLLRFQKVHGGQQTVNRERPTAGSQIAEAFMQKVAGHFMQYKTISQYARALHISPKHLSETIKKETGKTALNIISEAKIEYAKALLLQTAQNINQIAYELQFEEANYFTAFFKKHTGQTPQQFRQIHR